ncbi:hypothetical protein THIOKS11490014 [Thiocapsa sp. KS1]|nr:hypothetical protein THIOKS11490014 [Thiocapsa sp. KS1]
MGLGGDAGCCGGGLLLLKPQVLVTVDDAKLAGDFDRPRHRRPLPIEGRLRDPVPVAEVGHR